jgi:flavin reductase (DIM6/NTAB) family NADH-FMN oxidoreductase RutF
MTRDATFEQLVADLDPAMLIVTAAAGGERSGCLVSFATQTSIDPSRFLVCISRTNHTFRVAMGADLLVVHLVHTGAAALAELFGGETGDDVDKFARVAWRLGPGGAPILDELDTWFAGRILDRIELGDHTGFLLDPVAGAAARAERPFTLHRASGIKAGHAP